ncbi:helix-turn-helix domain-containing protein [Oryzisolibacter sp. LB2S]|uniref:GlxA family transcriptional regulator n=1 Tax=Alicycliphilus soli TaxID=3228789 RepID=UPI0034576D81
MAKWPEIGSFVPAVDAWIMPSPDSSPAHGSGPTPRHVSLVALPEAAVSTLAGLFDVLRAPALLRPPDPSLGDGLCVQVVGQAAGRLTLTSGVPVEVQRAIDTIEKTDIVIVPSLWVLESGWTQGRYAPIVEWVRRMHAHGALLCSACTGIFLLAETGLFDNRDATVHFDYARQFRASFPAVRTHPELVLVVAGDHEELISSGASNTWHDLALYLIARFVGAADAQELARRFALQWHQDGLTPFMIFEGKLDHGDAEIATAQRWLANHFAIANAVDEMVRQSRLAERTFKRRFVIATGLTPIDYVQRLRVEDAKRRLERTDAPVDEISWRVGYEDAAFFRRLFKRTTGMAPGAYRKRFRIPDFARP